MLVFRRLVFTAVIAGLVTGGLVALAHHFGTASIIARAETYERAADGAEKAPAARVAGAAQHDHHAATRAPATPAPAWEPEDGLERTLYSAVAEIWTAIAFSLLLATAIEFRGGDANWRTGLFWGLAGFAVFTLAPSLGLPPEVPGTAAAPLEARQAWWASTAAATAGGLALLFLQRRPWWAAAGVALLIAPHLYGAPQSEEYASAAPGALAHQFAVTVTLTSLLFWTLLGSLTGALLDLMRHASAGTAAAGAFSLESR